MDKYFNHFAANLTNTPRYLNNNGTKKAFRDLKKYYSGSKIINFKKNKKVGLWKLPLQWEVKKGILYDPTGKKISDYSRNPLELFSNSVSFKGNIKKSDLLENHIYSDKNRPSIIPFHYQNQFREKTKEWGFSVPYNKIKKFKNGTYKVDIQTSFKKSDMESCYYEKKGKNKNKILFVSHFDHPNQINDGLSGTLCSFELLSKLKRTKLSYAALSTPEIIGSIFFAKKYAKMKKIKHALMLNFCGTKSGLVYSKTTKENTFIDQIIFHILRFKKNSKIVKFREIIGADEIAFDNEIYKIPCGSIYRWPYKDYHTNKDNFKNFNFLRFRETLNFLNEIIFIIENNSTFKNRFKDLPKLSDPSLDLYFSPRYWQTNKILFDKKRILGSDEKIQNLIKEIEDEELRKACWDSAKNIQLLQSYIPAKCDGNFSTLELANLCNMPFRMVDALINLWDQKKLIKKNWINPFKK